MGDVVVGQRVDGLFAPSRADDKAGGAQHPQVLGRQGL
jgi:hypothetical protein